ncbi:hypothetical protein QYE76_013386 [Lolium multiflorum]|uniref:Retrotransposon Copia-like N-terminal domain-containing protein n=1 Tax=Lolium multiflorum TaxID=4521 RepID=A0AAD8U3U7_LOLMU|nr:hypothetical protein QYE76_013386 [Lolium multiflorum]
MLPLRQRQQDTTCRRCCPYSRRCNTVKIAMSSSSSTMALAAAMGAPPVQPLTRKNFLAWKALVLPAFRGARVIGLLNGSDRAPAEIVEIDGPDKEKNFVEKPAYVAWIGRDQQALIYLLNSLSPDILSHVLGAETTVAAWKTIDNMFKTVARSKVQHLRSELNDTKKLQMSADEYYTKMKGFASELATVGKSPDDDELIGYMLCGLDVDHYNALIANINAPRSLKRGSLPLPISLVVVVMTVMVDTMVHVVAAAPSAGKQIDAWSTVEEEEADGPVTVETAVMDRGDVTMHTHGRMVVVTVHSVVMMMTIAAMMVAARDVVALTVLPHPLLTPPIRSTLFMATLPRIVGGAMRMMMIVTTRVTRVTRVQTLHPMV